MFKYKARLAEKVMGAKTEIGRKIIITQGKNIPKDRLLERIFNEGQLELLRELEEGVYDVE